MRIVWHPSILLHFSFFRFFSTLNTSFSLPTPSSSSLSYSNGFIIFWNWCRTKWCWLPVYRLLVPYLNNKTVNGGNCERVKWWRVGKGLKGMEEKELIKDVLKRVLYRKYSLKWYMCFFFFWWERGRWVVVMGGHHQRYIWHSFNCNTFNPPPLLLLFFVLKFGGFLWFMYYQCV